MKKMRLIAFVLLLLTLQSCTTNSLIPAVTPASADEVPRISLEEARTAFDAEEAIFLDVRSPESYAQVHVTGAINIPLDQLEVRIGELDPNAWIITYCT
jgi:3-mercaptopyruvate sulfurtransferase SseA